MRTEAFDYAFRFAGLTDIGKLRESNMDEVILCPELGFFAVSDGMGGLAGGKLAAEFVRKSMPELMGLCMKEYAQHGDIEKAAESFCGMVQKMSDELYAAGNMQNRFIYGATFSGVWLLADKAIYVNLGDSRGYLLPKYKKLPRQITCDQNMAGLYVKEGLMTKAEAKDSPMSSRLTAFVGMQAPAAPEVFIRDIHSGDRLLLCSDGLYGMMEEREMAKLMRMSRSPERVCGRLIDKANENGGRDNISAAYIHIQG